MYSQAVADDICDQIADGTPLRVICRTEGMPAWRTVYHWLEERPEFAARFARAREIGFDAIAEECLDIADAVEYDTVKTEGGDRANTEWITRSRLRVDTRLKLLSKWDPKRYGDKLETTVKGGPANVMLSATDAAL